MKNQKFLTRQKFALAGIWLALKEEKSIRTQMAGAVFALGCLIYFRPDPWWWAAFLLASGAVLSLELINTALEAMMDQLHPGESSLIKKAKDCAAGAVWMACLTAISVFAVFVVTQFRG